MCVFFLFFCFFLIDFLTFEMFNIILLPVFVFFCFCFVFFVVFLAHLSQRLIDELIGNPWSVVVRRLQCSISNIFFSETACPIKAKFYVDPPSERGTKICSRHLGHIAKMAATPKYGKNPSKIFSGTGRSISTNLGM